MKPLIAGKALAAWLLRLMMIWYAYVYFFGTFTGFELRDLSFYIAAVYIVFSVLLFIGAFLKRQSVTVVSGLLILLVAVFRLIRAFPEDIGRELLNDLIPAILGFYFLAHGNTD